jgi:hypothetical protein
MLVVAMLMNNVDAPSARAAARRLHLQLSSALSLLEI